MALCLFYLQELWWPKRIHGYLTLVLYTVHLKLAFMTSLLEQSTMCNELDPLIERNKPILVCDWVMDKQAI